MLYEVITKLDIIKVISVRGIDSNSIWLVLKLTSKKYNTCTE